MPEPKRVLLTHYDLDGVGCEVQLSQLYTFKKAFRCGYAKADEHIINGNLLGYDSCVITDMALKEYQYDILKNEYGRNFVFIDHHSESIRMVDGFDIKKRDNQPVCLVDGNFSATGIIFQAFKDLAKIPGLPEFVISVDAYDNWRHKTHPEEFKKGYNLNTLFWKYKYNSFLNRFTNDPTMKWSKQEQEWIDNYLNERDTALEESDRNEFGDNSLLVLGAPSGHINDYGLVYPEYDHFFLVYTALDGKLAMSVRSNESGVDVGRALSNAKDNNEEILNAGGHPEAGGMAFVDDDISVDRLLDIVEEINNELEVPF